MNQGTFLISRFLLAEHPELGELSGNTLREKLHSLLKDPLLWMKLDELHSEKYTMQYQAPNQMLKRVDFYPYPEDWCFLSILSWATGYSRCYIFIHLLLHDLGVLKLKNDGTPLKLSDLFSSEAVFCAIGMHKSLKIYRRRIITIPKEPLIPIYPVIKL